MVMISIGIVLLLFGLFTLALQRFYSCVPAKELKRLAARGDHLAAALYSPVAYGASMRLLLWVLFAGGIAGGLFTLVSTLTTWAVFAVTFGVLMSIVWLLSVRLTVHSARIAVTAAPLLKYVLDRAHPFLHRIARFINHFREHVPHSGLYEKEDLLALLEQQKEQVDNRIHHAELEMMTRAVQFDDIGATDIVLPWSKVVRVSVKDHIGPVLLGELHNSGQDSFVVYDNTPEHPVGTLFLRDAVRAKAGGLVGDLMHKNISFVHEDFTLRQVLGVFVQTGQLMVVVVNSFEEAVGVITLKDLLSYLLGEQSVEELPYEDRSAMANFVPSPQLQPAEVPAITEDPTDPPSSPEETEVVK